MGTLYVVGTPIGNLSDITLRALETLKGCDRIVAEDTRVTAKLLARYDIRKPLFSLHARSPRGQFEKVVRFVENGEKIALVTDAGTPGISDPGARIVELVRERCGEQAIVPIPGPSAIAAALSASGIAADEFLFLGFPPHKKGRQKLLDRAVAEECAVVFYESPHRVGKLLAGLSARAPERRVVVARELTKLFESVSAGTAREVESRFARGDISSKGEFVVILAPPR